MAGEQNFKVFLSFKDEATGKFIKATEEQINAIKKLGITVKKEGAGVGVELDKMAKAHENLGRKSRSGGQDITGFIRAMGSLRNMILVYMFALRPLFDLIKKSTEAYIEQEDAVVRLNYALGLQGSSAERVSGQLVSLSKEFQNTTRYSDEMALQIMDKLVTLGNVMPNELEKVTKAVLDFASTTRRDPVDAADLFVKASNGISTGLRRAGIIIDEATPKTKLLAEAIRYVNENMGGRAQNDIKTYGGSIAQLNNSISELRESTGKLIITGLDLPYLATFYKNLFNEINQAVTGEGITVLGTLEKQLSDINKKITSSGAEAISKQKSSPLWFITGGYSQSEIEKAQNLFVEKNSVMRAIDFEKQVQANQKVLDEQKILEEKQKQLKIKAQDDFTVAYNALAINRIAIERSTLDKDYAIYAKFVTDKIALNKWYQEETVRIHKEELRLTPRMETAEESIASLKEYLEQGGKAYIDLMTNFSRGAEKALTDTFINVVKGNFESLGDVVVAFGDTMLQTIMQIAAQSILIKVGLSSFLGVHTGGYMLHGISSSAGYGRRKYHQGGEVNATLLEGEGVVNKKGMTNLGVDNLNKLNRGEDVGGGQTINNYYIQTIDERSFRDRLMQHGDIYTSASEMNMKDNGSTRRTNQRYS